MKRHKRILAVMLSAFMLNSVLCPYSVLAEDIKAEEKLEDTANDGILTVEEATELAIKNSNSLKNISESLSLAEDDADDANHDLFYATEYNEVTSLSVQLKNLRNSISNYKANSEIEKQSLELSVIQMFTAIKEAENSLKLCKEKISLSEKELKVSEVKYSLGLITENDYISEKNSLKKLETQRDSLKISLDDAYTSLNKILGYDLDEKYEISLEVSYTPFEEDMPLETKILKALSSCQSITEKEESVTIAKYEVDVYSSLYSNDKKESKTNKYNQAVRSLNDAKTDLRQSITSLYNNIQTTEKSYKDNLNELEQMQKTLAIKETELSLGKTTAIEVEKYKYEIESLENTIQNQIYEHNILIIKYNNPDLI